MARLGDRPGDIADRQPLAHAQDDVEALDRRPGCPHAFAQPAPQPVAVHGARHGLAADDVTNPAGILRSGRGDQLQEMRVVANAELEQRFECACAAQPVADAAASEPCNGRQTVRRARPLARRAARTLRPPTVFIRARNPCVRARLTFEG